MKNIVLAGILMLMVWAHGASSAETERQKPGPSSPLHIAMTFYKLARQLPDFDGWARQTQAYADAPAADKAVAALREAQALKDMYSLLILQEPLVIETPVQLSGYSASNGGFFVESFKEDTFFQVRHNGRAYAIVPQGITDRQFLQEEDPAMIGAIEAAKKGGLMMTLLLSPTYADGTAPVALDGENYWPLSAVVDQMILHAADGAIPLWQSQDSAADNQKHRELLNLRQ